MRPALFYERLNDHYVHCLLCPQDCRIAPGRSGFCRVRHNHEGILYTENYGKCSSYGMDPIEKKPLYHFYPGSNIFSIGTTGCNFTCGFCQNWRISQEDAPTTNITPEEVADIVTANMDDNGCIGVAYTYSEPFMWYEFIIDTAPLIHRIGRKNVLVTNGFVRLEPLKNILPYIDAMNIDVKGFTDDFYHRTCHGSLAPVKQTVEESYDKCHIEITTLLIPGLNDDPERIKAMVTWLADLSPEIPLHFSRYFPQYKMNREPTPLATLKMAREIAKEKLKYVYIGNVWEGDGMQTYCPSCGNLLINRKAYQASNVGLANKRCAKCGETIKIIGEIIEMD